MLVVCVCVSVLVSVSVCLYLTVSVSANAVEQVTAACAAEAECPLSYLYENDGLEWVQGFKQMAQNGLKRPINRLYDDGEILGTWHMLNHALDEDPVMVRCAASVTSSFVRC